MMPFQGAKMQVGPLILGLGRCLSYCFLLTFFLFLFLFFLTLARGPLLRLPLFMPCALHAIKAILLSINY